MFFLFVTICAFLITVATANACSCGPRPAVLDAFDQSEVVIIARVISVERVTRSAKVEGVPKNRLEDSDKDAEDPGQQYVDDVRSATMVSKR